MLGCLTLGCSGSGVALDLGLDMARDGAVVDAVGPDHPALDLTPIDAPRPDLLPTCPAGRWCSTLYPPTWYAGFPADAQGRFLPDFSHAGYHAGAALPVSPPGQVYDVVSGFGADSSGGSDASLAIQAAIDAAETAGGGLVLIPAGVYRCDGTLVVQGDNVVLRGAGKGQTLLHFTTSQGMSGKSHITLRGEVQRGADILLAQDAKTRDVDLFVDDLAGLKVGDEVAIGWVITADFVAQHGMTGTWTVFLDQWKPFFRCTVTAVDASTAPRRVTVDVPLRYDALVRDKASLRQETGYLRECGVEHLSLSNAVKWDDAWGQSQVHVLELTDAKDCWVQDVHSTKSPQATGWSALDTTLYHVQSGGILVLGSRRVTVADSSMHNAQHRGGGGNGYLFEISRSNEVLLRDCEATGGRHNLIQNWDFGTTGCVFLRCTSSGSQYATVVLGVPIFTPAMCEYHHSLAMANLVDQCVINDGWQALNRLNESSGAGHTSTRGVFWNTVGTGTLISRQYGWGHVIGTGPQITVDTALGGPMSAGTQPQDQVEGADQAATLWPPSLYDNQRKRRLGL